MMAVLHHPDKMPLIQSLGDALGLKSDQMHVYSDLAAAIQNKNEPDILKNLELVQQLPGWNAKCELVKLPGLLNRKVPVEILKENQKINM